MAWYNGWGGSRRTTSSYSSRESASSWSSRYSWENYREKEDNSNLIIKQPEGYLTPTKSEINNKLQYGNRYTGFYSSRESVSEAEVEFVKNFSHFFYHDMLGEKPEDTFIDKYSEDELSNRSEEELKKYHNYKQAFDKIVDIKVPFYTPLEKSIFYLEQLKDMAKQQNKSMDEMMKELGQQMQNMEIDEENLNNKNVNEILDRMLGQYEEPEEVDDEDFDDIFGNGDEEGDEDGEGEGQGNGEGEGEDGEEGNGKGSGDGEGEEEGDGDGSENWGNKKKAPLKNNKSTGKRQQPKKGNGGNAGGDSTPEHIFRGVLDRYASRGSDGKRELAYNKSELLKNISRIADFGDKFAIEKEIVTKATFNSRQRRNIRMTSLDQVANVDILQRILPNFPVKLAVQDLRVDTPIKTTENKQKIIILIDRSGSMSSNDKGKWIMAFMADRLKSVMEEEAEIFVSNFEAYTSDLHFYHAYDRDSALKLMKEYSWYPNGGGTNVGDMIKHIADEINNKGKLHNLNVDLSREKVEILVINDGQDSVGSDNLPWKTNALTLCDGINDQLKKLCLKTGGKYIFVEQNGNIQEFE